MKWSNRIILSLILFNFRLVVSFSSERIEVTSKFIQDLIKNENFPIVLTVKQCWNMNERADFSTRIGASVDYISNVTELLAMPRNHFTHELWFLVDLNCTEGSSFLEEVCS